jgi:predicted acylesterase/phospholipase RssA
VRLGSWLSLLAILGCAACRGGSPPAPSASAGDPRSARFAREAQKGALAPVRGALRESLSKPGRLQVLALSGGGQWGAFGAGFLKGWTRRGDRPAAFQVVTGTSTGSLQATFAFLGEDFDDAVGRAYLDIRGDSDVMKKRFLLTAALFSDALATTGPLRLRLEASITDAVLSRVAAEGSKGRKLFVGAVDLDSGVFRAFDLTEIAARGPAARKDYLDALMASTAIPVAFPPVEIGGRTYVDGGVRRNVFLELVVDELAQLRKVEITRGLVEPQATVYCLVNGTLNVGAVPVKRHTIDIGRRSVDILLDESTDGNLLRVFLLAQRAQLRFLMTHVPPDVCNAVGSDENQFDPQLMRCLYDEGEKWAQRDEAWSTEPPLEGAGP